MLWNIGDFVYSAQSGRTYRIISRHPKVLLQILEIGPGDNESLFGLIMEDKDGAILHSVTLVHHHPNQERLI